MIITIIIIIGEGKKTDTHSNKNNKEILKQKKIIINMREYIFPSKLEKEEKDEFEVERGKRSEEDGKARGKEPTENRGMKR